MAQLTKTRNKLKDWAYTHKPITDTAHSNNTCRLLNFLSLPCGSPKPKQLYSVEHITESVIGETESSSQSSHVACWAFKARDPQPLLPSLVVVSVTGEHHRLRDLIQSDPSKHLGDKNHHAASTKANLVTTPTKTRNPKPTK